MSRKISEYIQEAKTLDIEGKEHAAFEDLVDQKIVIHEVSPYEKDGLRKYMMTFTMNGVECYSVASASVVVSKLDVLSEMLKDEKDWDMEVTVIQKVSKKTKKNYYDIV